MSLKQMVSGCSTAVLLVSAAAAQAWQVRPVPGQAELGSAEIHGVGAGEFRADLWRAGALHFLPDARHPLLEPRRSGVYRNIYAPSAVELPEGWRLFYGAWDGVGTGNDRIYSTLTRDFLDFGERRTVIEHGDYVHVCNVSALRLPDGAYRLMCTAYPDAKGLNKPALFTSPDGEVWNGAPAPYPARRADLIPLEGYAPFAEADINGMNVLLYEEGAYRLYFCNFKDFGRIYRATSDDGKRFRFEGPALEMRGVVNDVKRFDVGGERTYLMGLHMNGDRLWYALSRDGRAFEAAKALARNRDAQDRYIVAIGWVTRGQRLLGCVYGAGAVPELNRNRLFARWLQKKLVFTADDGTRCEPVAGLGPDRRILSVPRDRELSGFFTLYAEDGTTVLMERQPGKLRSGQVVVVSP